jgi:hypothetical protein
MPNETPVTEALELLNQNFSNQEMTSTLEKRGYNLQEISDAINQAKIKQGVEGKMPPQNMQESAMDQDIPVPQQEEVVQQQIPVQQAAPPAEQPQMYQQPQYQMPQQQGPNYGDMQALVEQIVEEKWRDLVKGVGDMNVFKARVGDEIESVKQELLRTQRRLEDLQVAVMGKVKDYNVSVDKIGSDMKALEQVFGKILEPLTMNVKELGRISQEMKRKHK